MDGCSSQLKLITSEENMNIKKKIRCCKHSAARTAVEQAADTGCMFEQMKRVINETHNPHSSNNSVNRFLDQTLLSLESRHQSEEAVSTRTLNLSLHKKKAILATVSKLPIATAQAYTDNNIKKAFVLNGQLDMGHRLVPSLNNLLNTLDTNSAGNIIDRGVNIQQENRRRAKYLTSKKQIDERREASYQSKLLHFNKMLILYNA